MARTNGPIQVWHRTDTIPTDAEGGYAGGDSTAAAVGGAMAQAGQAVATVGNLSATVTALPAGASPTVTVTGVIPNKVINFSIPRGADGAPGMGYEEGQQLVSQNQTTLTAAQAAQTSAASAASDAADAVTLAQQAQAAALEVPDANMAAAIDNPATDTHAALGSYWTPAKRSELGMPHPVPGQGSNSGRYSLNVNLGTEGNVIADDLSGCVILGGTGMPGTSGPGSGYTNVIGLGKPENIWTGEHNYDTTDLTLLRGSGAGVSIVGGYDNLASGLATIMFGYHCYVATAADHSTISGGASHQILSGSRNTISGGSAHTITGNSNTVVGGYENTVNASSSVVGGHDNTVSGTAPVAFGIGNTATGNYPLTVGSNNKATRNFATAIGRTNEAGGENSVALGAFNTTDSSSNGGIALGRENTTTGGSAAAAIGMGNTSSGVTSLAIGNGSEASGNYSVAMGRTVTASGFGAYATGYYSHAASRGQFAQASGRFDVNGDAQTSVATAYRNHTNTAVTSLSLNGSSEFITIPTDRAAGFVATIVARDTANADTKMWRIEGALKNTDGTVTFVGSPSVSVVAEDAGATGWTADSDITGTTLRVRVGAAAGVHSMARIELTEVG